MVNYRWDKAKRQYNNRYSTQLLWENKQNRIRFQIFVKRNRKKIEDFYLRIKFKTKNFFLIGWNKYQTSGNPQFKFGIGLIKHFAFGKDLHLLIYSDFGVEFIDPSFEKITENDFEDIKMRKNNKFYLIDSDKDVDFEQIDILYKKFPNKCGIWHNIASILWSKVCWLWYFKEYINN